jgi:hypothetical protein
MRIRAFCFAVAVLAAPAAVEAAEPAALARARALYNAGSYGEAIDSAAAARKEPLFADAAALVMSRALLERYRLTPDPADLATARETLRGIQMAPLTPRDQVDLLIGLGQALYLSDSFGAAAELFETALGRSAPMGARDRTRLLEWWATAVDREAQTRSADRRGELFGRVARTMDEELRSDPGSAVANYWLVVAARGQGDLDRAWDAAVAAWVRAGLSPASTDTVRADIERIVTQALVPERSRTRPPREQQDAATAMRAEWEQIKQQWK